MLIAALPGLIFQDNLNHSAGAQDLLMQTLTEKRADLAIIAEPYRVPDNPNWVTGISNSIAIFRRGDLFLAIYVHCRENGFVVAKWGNMGIVGVYTPPSWPLEQFEKLMDRIGGSLPYSGCVNMQRL